MARRRESRSGEVRISAGKWKGRTLEVPRSARPTSSRAREALFDILAPVLPGARVLDLHAGSGAVGLEALSRGAERAVLVDVDVAAAQRNAEKVGAGEAALVLASDAEEALRRLASRGTRFDVVFSDPPYGVGPGSLAEVASVLDSGGVLVVQADAGSPPPGVPGGLAQTSERAYGRNVFHFFVWDERARPR